MGQELDIRYITIVTDSKSDEFIISDNLGNKYHFDEGTKMIIKNYIKNSLEKTDVSFEVQLHNKEIK